MISKAKNNNNNKTTWCNLLSNLCHSSQTVYLTQQNIISSNNGLIFNFSIDQSSSSPFDKHILLRNDFKMQFFLYWAVPCLLTPSYSPYSLPFYLFSPFAVKLPNFIYLIIWQWWKKYYHEFMRQLKCPLMSSFSFRWQRHLPCHKLMQCSCILLSECTGVCVCVCSIFRN